MAAIIHPLLTLLASLTRQELARQVTAPDKRPKAKDAKPGRPRVEESISEAIIRIRKETGWGYTKIVQAMRRLGHNISRQTVKNVLVDAGLGPQPHDTPIRGQSF